jgi:hypothetical protein
MLLRTLYRTGEFESLTYRDMPFVLMPQLWAAVSKPHYKAGIAAERAHGDSILVDFAALKALNAYTGGRFPEMRTRGPITCAPMNPRMKSLKCFAPILI